MLASIPGIVLYLCVIRCRHVGIHPRHRICVLFVAGMLAPIPGIILYLCVIRCRHVGVHPRHRICVLFVAGMLAPIPGIILYLCVIRCRHVGVHPRHRIVSCVLFVAGMLASIPGIVLYPCVIRCRHAGVHPWHRIVPVCYSLQACWRPSLASYCICVLFVAGMLASIPGIVLYLRVICCRHVGIHPGHRIVSACYSLQACWRPSLASYCICVLFVAGMLASIPGIVLYPCVIRCRHAGVHPRHRIVSVCHSLQACWRPSPASRRATPARSTACATSTTRTAFEAASPA